MHLTPCRLSVAEPFFWGDLAAQVAACVPVSLRWSVALDLQSSDRDILRFARAAAEKVLRGACPGRMSLEHGFGDVLLCLVALDVNPAAANAYRQQLLAELEGERS